MKGDKTYGTLGQGTSEQNYMYGGGAVDTWNYDYNNYRMMSLTFIPVVDKVAADKEVLMRLHYTNSWSDWPSGTNGNWTCLDTFMMENNIYRDHKPWDESDNFFIQVGLWFEAHLTLLLCYITNPTDNDHCKTWD